MAQMEGESEQVGPRDDEAEKRIRDRDTVESLMMDGSKMVLTSDKGRIYAFSHVLSGTFEIGQTGQDPRPKLQTRS